ncbi:hypothetical protein LIER_17250 [Lithospermum erythrorhizon]|uniref:CCHC-type domain-containing protein n=1 Tax=Lithospermum erythrorhizon TaxID=34254 RepID=A0AAV3QC97_LITER
MDASMIKRLLNCNLNATDLKLIRLEVEDLDEEFFTWDVASKLANYFSGCKEVELRRAKWANVLQPLRRMIQFQLEEDVITGYLAYERLPHLCFKCGRLGHLIRQCPELGEGADPKKECVYDLWIKAPMEKSWMIFRLNEEYEDCLPRRAGDPLPKKHIASSRCVRGERIGETNHLTLLPYPATQNQGDIDEDLGHHSYGRETDKDVTVYYAVFKNAIITPMLPNEIREERDGKLSENINIEGALDSQRVCLQDINGETNKEQVYPNTAIINDSISLLEPSLPHQQLGEDDSSLEDPAIITMGGISPQSKDGICVWRRMLGLT